MNKLKGRMKNKIKKTLHAFDDVKNDPDLDPYDPDLDEIDPDTGKKINKKRRGSMLKGKGVSQESKTENKTLRTRRIRTLK